MRDMLPLICSSKLNTDNCDPLIQHKFLEFHFNYVSKVLKFSIISILILFQLSSAQIHLSGALTEDLVDTTYIIDDDISINNLFEFNIAAGARLEFTEGTEFIVNNSNIYVNGVEGDSVYFVRHDTDLPWAGIDVQATSATATINFAVILGSNNTGIRIIGNISLNDCLIAHNQGGELQTGGVYYSQTFSMRALTNCNIVNNVGSGLYLDHAPMPNEPIIYNCLISNNSGYGLEWDGHEGLIRNCEISHNSGSGVLGITNAPGKIDSCTIHHNFYSEELGTNGGAVRLSYTIGRITISNSSIYENVSVDYGNIVSRVVSINNCLIYSNTSDGFAGGIGCSDTSSIKNCTFYNNQAAIEGAAIYYSADEQDSITVENNIFVNHPQNAVFGTNDFGANSFIFNHNSFYNNEFDPFNDIDYDTTGIMTQTNFNGDICDTNFNIFLDPQFVNVEEFDFHLLEGSPCVDAGNPEFTYDPDGTISDIGALFYNQTYVKPDNDDSHHPENFSISRIYPNPANSSFRIKYNLNQPAHLQMSLYNILGKEVLKIPNIYNVAGSHEYSIDTKGLGSGTYFVRFTQMNNNTSVSQKILLLK